MPVKIGGILYPSQSWYQENVLKKGRKAAAGRETAVAPQAPIAPTGISQTIGGIMEGLRGVSKGIGALGTTPQTTDMFAGFGAGADPKQNLIQQLSQALQGAVPTTPLEEQYTGLREERGIPELETKIGTFGEEIGKAKGLLTDLEASLKRGMLREEGRPISMPLITGRQQALQKQAAIERGDILGVLETMQRGRGMAGEELGRRMGEVTDIMGLRKEERGLPLETFGRGADILSQLRGVYEAPTSVVEAGGRMLLVNTQTGETIKDLGESRVAGATTTDTRKSIVANINSAVDQYRLNPEGFRESFIKGLLTTYGEPFRDYIQEQVYTLMPDIIEEGEGEQFITKDWLLETFGRDKLIEAMKEAGGTQWLKTRKGELVDYLDGLMKMVEAWRQAGKSDAEILKQMQ